MTKLAKEHICITHRQGQQWVNGETRAMLGRGEQRQGVNGTAMRVSAIKIKFKKHHYNKNLGNWNLQCLKEKKSHDHVDFIPKLQY